MDDGMRAAKMIADPVEETEELEKRKKTTTSEFNAELSDLRERLGHLAKDIHSGQVNFLEQGEE